MDFPIEPFRIKVVETIRPAGRAEREALLERAGYNLFAVPAKSIYIDLFTDSGTSAMSDEQWSRLMVGDEAYAGSKSFELFERSVRALTGYRHVIPTHQGRAAEHLLFTCAVSPDQRVPGTYHFDTTRANIEQRGGIAVDLVCRDATDIASDAPFKGNMDLGRLDAFLTEHRGAVPLVMVTVTNNAGGGQPVSMENIRATREITRRHGIPLFFDACRFAENSWLVREREREFAERPVIDIAREMFALGDGCTMSAKKDGLANIGGFVALNDDELAAAIRTRLILIEGFPTYGGLAGRDLEAIARGLEEVVEPDYLRFRIGQVRAFGEALERAGVPVVKPFGGHAVYVDIRRFFPHIPQSQFPAQAFTVELYRRYGIRTGEFGALTFSTRDPETQTLVPPALELVRLAVPRRVYTASQLQFTADSIAELFAHREDVRGFEIEWQAPFLRHFTARLKPL